MQLLGVYDEYLAEPLAQVLINLGVRRGMVVYGQEKLDEISVTAPTSVCEIQDGWFKSYVITPEEFGIEALQPGRSSGRNAGGKREDHPRHSERKKRDRRGTRC